MPRLPSAFLASCIVAAVAPLPAGAAERVFDAAGFDEVALDGPDRVEVVPGDEFSVRATGEERALETLVAKSRDGALRVGREGAASRDGRDGEDGRDGADGADGTGGEAVVRVTMPAIRGAAVAGSGTLDVERPDVEAFRGSVSGSGRLEIADLRAARATFSIGGSGDVVAAGEVPAVRVDVAGSGTADLAGLRAKRLEASVAGSGDVRARVSGSATASIAGSGSVEVTGGADCRSEVTGPGAMRCD